MAAVPLASPVFGFSTVTGKNSKIKVGLVGCGGRGTGAIFQALDADPDVIVTALADVFPENLEATYAALLEKYGDRIQVPAAKRYIGFEAFKSLVTSDVDVVLLCTPPNFRPQQLTAAVQAGKHVFCEKPVAIDIPGIHEVQEAVKLAKSKQLNIVSGFCFRYSFPNRELVKRIGQGDIGTIKSITTFRHGGELTLRDRQAAWSDVGNQMQNWFFYQRYSGDIIVEQTVHSIDFMNWVMGNRLPLKVAATGGRQSRPPEALGNVFDHFAVEYDYGDGVKGIHFGRQQNGTTPRNTVEVMGSTGHVDVALNSSYAILGDKPWKNTERLNNMYQTQHDELFQAIRKKQPINDGDSMVNSTLLAIWGREAAYSGKEISYEEIIQSKATLGPTSEAYSWDMKGDELPVPQPGLTKFV